MTLEADALEARIGELRAAVRRSMAAGDRATARRLRAELREAERSWDAAVLGGGPPARPGPQVREQALRALDVLGAPAAPRLVAAVHAALHGGDITGSRLANLRRDEERAFRSAPHARAHYVCAALTADLLAPARGLLTVGSWPLERRVVGRLSARTDFLTAAIRLAGHPRHGEPAVQRLLWRFAANIPGASGGALGTVDAAALAAAAQAELDVHLGADRRERAAAAARAARLGDAERLFGHRLRALRAASGGLPHDPSDGERR
ncbi:hypothetical protein [Actinomadura parmotrematis]|uniref:CHAD domain-containing protein n=1 Tax=Actinomadura parmotrematis TaxID=2864039 RepID=A0ABS7G0B7_9ACTN|nr:hypothetical protein [Actinomadura parmotrematis]MBW8486155.1 hypothetical protein [Actinomadura parmotrematis]